MFRKFLKHFLKPILEMAYKAAVEFMKFWRSAPWQQQLVLLPILLVCLLVWALYKFFFGDSCE